MATEPLTIPQPLNGEEIRKGIAARIAAEMPPEHAEKIKEIVYQGLGKTCSLEGSTAYAKFKAKWWVTTKVRLDTLLVDWRVEYELDDFGRVTKGVMGDNIWLLNDGVPEYTGHIPEVPPDRFRRETDQPIPKPQEVKKPDPQQTGLSRSPRGQGKRRNV